MIDKKLDLSTMFLGYWVGLLLTALVVCVVMWARDSIDWERIAIVRITEGSCR